MLRLREISEHVAALTVEFVSGGIETAIEHANEYFNQYALGPMDEIVALIPLDAPYGKIDLLNVIVLLTGECIMSADIDNPETLYSAAVATVMRHRGMKIAASSSDTEPPVYTLTLSKDEH